MRDHFVSVCPVRTRNPAILASVTIRCHTADGTIIDAHPAAATRGSGDASKPATTSATTQEAELREACMKSAFGSAVFTYRATLPRTCTAIDVTAVGNGESLCLCDACIHSLTDAVCR